MFTIVMLLMFAEMWWAFNASTKDLIDDEDHPVLAFVGKFAIIGILLLIQTLFIVTTVQLGMFGM